MMICCLNQIVLESHSTNTRLCHAANDDTAFASWIFLHDIISAWLCFSKSFKHFTSIKKSTAYRQETLSLLPCSGLKSSAMVHGGLRPSAAQKTIPSHWWQLLRWAPLSPAPLCPVALLPSGHCALWLCYQYWDPSANLRLLFSRLAASQGRNPKTQQKPHLSCSQRAAAVTRGTVRVPAQIPILRTEKSESQIL